MSPSRDMNGTGYDVAQFPAGLSRKLCPYNHGPMFVQCKLEATADSAQRSHSIAYFLWGVSNGARSLQHLRCRPALSFRSFGSRCYVCVLSVSCTSPDQICNDVSPNGGYCIAGRFFIGTISGYSINH